MLRNDLIILQFEGWDMGGREAEKGKRTGDFPIQIKTVQLQTKKDTTELRKF